MIKRGFKAKRKFLSIVQDLVKLLNSHKKNLSVTRKLIRNTRF